jgi:lysophospholipase L1-like esterase
MKLLLSLFLALLTVPAWGGLVTSSSSLPASSVAWSVVTNPPYARASSVTNVPTIACWGDSLTEPNAGTDWPTILRIMSGFTTYNGGVSAETSAQIKTRLLADTAKLSWPTIIWAGRNDITNTTQVTTNIAAMVSGLGHSNYLVLGILNANTEYGANATYQAITNLNASLSGIYQSRFIDMRSYLVSCRDTNIAQDVTDYGNDVVPTSLRTDFIHPNAAGNVLVAGRIYNCISTLIGYTNELVSGPMLNYILSTVPINNTNSIRSLSSITTPILNYSNLVYTPGWTSKTNAGFELFEHFTGNTGVSAENGWHATALSANGGTFALYSFTGLQGVGYWQTGANGNGVATIINGYYYLGAARTRFMTMLWPVTAYGAGEDYYVKFGLAQETAGGWSNAVYFSYVGAESTNWQTITCAANTGTTNISSSAVIANSTGQILACDIAADRSSAVFYYNSTPIATNTLNIPAANRSLVFRFEIGKTAGTGNRALFSDWCWLKFGN